MSVKKIDINYFFQFNNYLRIKKVKQVLEIKADLEDKFITNQTY